MTPPLQAGELTHCVPASRTEGDIAKVEGLESELGLTSLGNPRVMFRPAKKMGALGIREIVRWAKSPPGAYDANQGTFDLEESHSGGGCDAGLCGS